MALDLRGICPLLQVFDMPASLTFYRDVLGFTLIESAPPADQVHGDAFGWAWLRSNGAELMLNAAYDSGAVRPSAPDPAHVAAHHHTVLYIGCPDVDGVYAQLLACGVAVEAPVVTSYGMKQLSLEDPDGFALCFHWPAGAVESVAA